MNAIILSLLLCSLALTSCGADATDNCDIIILRPIPEDYVFSAKNYFEGKYYEPSTRLHYLDGELSTVLMLKSEGYLERPVDDIMDDTSYLENEGIAPIVGEWEHSTWLNDSSYRSIGDRGDTAVYRRHDSLFMRICR